MCNCMCMCVDSRKVHISIELRGRCQSSFSSTLPPNLLRIRLHHWNWTLTPDQQEPRICHFQPTHITIPKTGVASINSYVQLYMVPGDPYSGSHAFRANYFPHGASSQHWKLTYALIIRMITIKYKSNILLWGNHFKSLIALWFKSIVSTSLRSEPHNVSRKIIKQGKVHISTYLVSDI